MKRKGLGHLNYRCLQMGMNAGHIERESLSVNRKDDQLDDAIIVRAVLDLREYSSTVPFWTNDNGMKTKPFIFVGRLSNRRKRRNTRG